MPPIFDLEKCTGCGICEECMADVIYMKKGGDQKIPYLKYPEECWHCGSCRQDCPTQAIKIIFPSTWLTI
jgi:adenylylsulfate reductase subunit B